MNIQNLATPDFIKNLPEFNGNPIDLSDFLEAADDAVRILDAAPNKFGHSGLGQ